MWSEVGLAVLVVLVAFLVLGGKGAFGGFFGGDKRGEGLF